MWDWGMVWRGLLLGAVFLADAIVLAELVKVELRDWQAQRAASNARRMPAENLGAQSL